MEAASCGHAAGAVTHACRKDTLRSAQPRVEVVGDRADMLSTVRAQLVAMPSVVHPPLATFSTARSVVRSMRSGGLMRSIPIIVVALFCTLAAKADEQADLERSWQTCCSAAAGCVVQRGSVPCELDPAVHSSAPPAPPAPAVALNAQVQEELAAPISRFKTPTGPAVTTRGILAIALMYPSYRHVVVGTIEGEYAELMPHPDAPGHLALMTWCTIRVHESFRGGVEGELLTVLFEGGSLSADFSYWPPHTPRCLPFDYGVFSVYEHDGVLRASDRATMSMLNDGLPWQAHPLTQLLRELAVEAEAAP